MPDNPYMVVGAGNGPNYSAPLLDWQGMANGIGNGLTQQWQKPPQPGAPLDIRSDAQKQAQPTQGQPAGWGARLAQLFGLNSQPQPGMLPQPPVQSAPGPTGIY